jgi:hypothetical protein
MQVVMGTNMEEELAVGEDPSTLFVSMFCRFVEIVRKYCVTLQLAYIR